MLSYNAKISNGGKQKWNHRIKTNVKIKRNEELAHVIWIKASGRAQYVLVRDDSELLLQLAQQLLAPLQYQSNFWFLVRGDA